MASSSAGPVKAKRSKTSPPSPFSRTSASRLASRQAMLSESSPKRMRSPTARRFAGRAKARQRSAPSRLCSMISTRAVASPRARRPKRRAGITRVSLRTSASPGRSRSRRSRMTWSLKGGLPLGLTTSRRAASRGVAGRSAMRSSGRSKSNRSTRMARLRDPQQHRAPDQEGGAGEASGRNLLNGKPEQAEVIENQARHELARHREAEERRRAQLRRQNDRAGDEDCAEAAACHEQPGRDAPPGQGYAV